MAPNNRRKRALELAANADTRAKTLRSLLAARKISLSTITEIAHAVQTLGGDLDVSIEELKIAGASYFESVRRSEQVLMQNGTFFEWTMCDPNLLLQKTLNECPSLARFYLHRMAEHPCSVDDPWSLIVMFDAFTPGSISCPRPLMQKTMNVAFNFLELGPAALSVDHIWLIPVSVRTCMMDDAVGGWAACLGIYLRVQLLGDRNIRTVGVTFSVDGERATVYATLKVLGSDGEGLKDGLDLKAYGGIVPCVKCLNVLKKNSNLAHRRPNFVEITCWDQRRFIPATRQQFEDHIDEVVEVYRQVRAGAMPQARLDALQKAFGVNANPSGLVADRRLRSCFSVLDVMCEDWMHGALQDGTLYISVQCILVSVKEKLGWETDRLERFLKADWCFPKDKSQKLRSVWRVFDSFSRSNMDEKIKFKATSSELLGMYVLLRHWIFTVVALQPVDLTAEINAFEACCKVIDLIMLLKKGWSDQACTRNLLTQLKAANGTALRLHIETFGTGMVRPKHHRMFHIPQQIENHKCVIDMFVMERLHLVVKESFANLCNTIDFEGSLLKGSMVRQIERLNEGTNLFGTLHGSLMPLRGYPRARAGAKLSYEGMAISVRDVVLRDGAAARVFACAEEDGNLFVLVHVWEFLGAVTAYSNRWRTRRRRRKRRRRRRADEEGDAEEEEAEEKAEEEKRGRSQRRGRRRRGMGGKEEEANH